MPSHPQWPRTEPPHPCPPISSIRFEVTLQATWLSEDTIKALPNGYATIQNYTIRKPPLRKKTRTEPLIPPPHPCGWRHQYTTYTTHQINPNLDAVPTGPFVLTTHPTSHESVLLHAPDGRLISAILKIRLQKLSTMYFYRGPTTTLREAIAGVILRHKASTGRGTFTSERKLHKQQKLTPQLEY
jgi:hypothetical protein